MVRDHVFLDWQGRTHLSDADFLRASVGRKVEVEWLSLSEADFISLIPDPTFATSPLVDCASDSTACNKFNSAMVQFACSADPHYNLF